MNPLQAELSRFPAFLTQALDRTGDPGARQRPGQDRWSLCEVLWHLADMEREYFSAALERGSLEGLTPPPQRDSNSKDPYLALSRFEAARSENLQRAGTPPVWQALSAHDARHRAQVMALLAQPR